MKRNHARRIREHDDLVRALLAALPGVDLVTIDDGAMPSPEDVFRAVAGADVLLGAHGAGHANALVMRGGACLVEVMPRTLGQAARIPGLTPVAVSLLLVHLKKLGRAG